MNGDIMTTLPPEHADYAALSIESLPERLAQIEAITAAIGDDTNAWQVQEVGDGNLNLVFIVRSPRGAVIVKQALPYVRLVGEGWPFPLYRAYYEHCALIRQEQRDPGRVPKVLHFDREQALIVMEFLSPHSILRRILINGQKVAGLGEVMGKFCARTAFRGSELSMSSEAKKADVALFSGNVALSAVTESLVFTDPYYGAEMNNHTPELDPVVAKLRGDQTLKVKVQDMLMRFASNTETMLHGDLHSGSIMAAERDVRVIDPEFAQYGPMGFDLGMLIANYLMAYFSQPAHRQGQEAAYQEWILDVIDQTVASFEAEFKALWSSERSGMLYPAALFEDQGQSSLPACEAMLARIRQDAAAVSGIEMHRRCLSLAHNADFEEITDTKARAPLEARNIMMGAQLIHDACTLPDIIAMARSFAKRDFL